MNNKGWGLRMMMVFLLLLSISLIISSFYVAKITKDDEENNINEKDNSNDDVINSNIYIEAEKSMNEIVKEYIKNNYNNEIPVGTLTINLTKITDLDNKNVLNSLKTKNCEGYTNVLFEEKLQFSSYIKCDKYETDGFVDFYLE